MTIFALSPLVVLAVTAPVDPTNVAVPSFRNHVIPALTKAGCNQGACHGAAAGKNGFRLSLRGYDAELDYVRVTREAGARRINLFEPAQSLLLLKPTLAVTHTGGKQLDTQSPEYALVARWIAAGAPPPRSDDPRIAGIEVSPRAQNGKVGAEMQLAVRARFSDGRVEDVTRWAKFTSADESVAKVSPGGLVKIEGNGETAINIGYLSQVASARVLAPYATDIDPRRFAAAARHNFIDDHVLRKLRRLGIPPASQCRDEEFVRRAYLDAAGILPTRPETEAFLADARPDKRARLVDALLERSEFVDYWAYKWSDLLLVASHKLPKENVRAFYRWIRARVAANTRWDRFVRELVTSTGKATENGAVNYFLIHRNPLDLSENFGIAFMGLALNCARCHNHPLEKWTQNDYYGFANLFARVAHKSAQAGSAEDVYATDEGEVLHPRTGAPMPPRPLDGRPMALADSRDRRVVLAAWLTSPKNPLFARTVVNRVWASFFGRGLVHPADDMRSTNPASNEELMAAVTEDFVAHGFDVKRLVRVIMSSASYQRSSEPTPANAMDDRYLSHYLPRRLPAEVLLDAIAQVTGVPERFTGYPARRRAMQLPDTNVDSRFMTVFGRPQRLITSVAERQQDPTLSQALHVINGETLNGKLSSKDGRIEALHGSGKTLDAILEELYLCAYSRRPNAEERLRAQAAAAEVSGAAASLSGAPDAARRQAIEDLAWAMLTSKEFFFNR